MKPSTVMNFTEQGYIDYTDYYPTDIPWFPSYEFERIDYVAFVKFVEQHRHYAIIASLIYIVVIFGIQHLMKNRKAFILQKELFLWNLALGIFSICGFLRMTPGLLSQLFKPDGGFYVSICVINGGSYPELFWAIAFILSKYVELGDTVFISLRKRNLQFIQWYHHLITLVTTWFVVPYAEPIARYYGCMNCGVHSLMYPYFAAKALNINIPKKIGNLITTLQLAQMLMGLFVNSYSAYLYYSGSPCYRHPSSMKMFALVYGSFVILFGKLFYDLVIARNVKNKKK